MSSIPSKQISSPAPSPMVSTNSVNSRLAKLQIDWVKVQTLNSGQRGNNLIDALMTCFSSLANNWTGLPKVTHQQNDFVSEWLKAIHGSLTCFLNVCKDCSVYHWSFVPCYYSGFSYKVRPGVTCFDWGLKHLILLIDRHLGLECK